MLKTTQDRYLCVASCLGQSVVCSVILLRLYCKHVKNICRNQKSFKLKRKKY